MPDTHTQAFKYLRKPVTAPEAYLSSGFGTRYNPVTNKRETHLGTDWGAPTGSPVMAAARGQVTYADPDGDSGNLIVIDHGNGWVTKYAHLDLMAVREGDCVTKGATIGTVGLTGATSKPHLHFEVLHHGESLNPLDLRPVRGGLINWETR